MAYFSNGTEGMDYQSRYCDQCVHDVDGSCPVWFLHLMYAYEECNNDGESQPLSNAKAMLDTLIPMTEENFADECKMFIKKENVNDE